MSVRFRCWKVRRHAILVVFFYFMRRFFQVRTFSMQEIGREGKEGHLEE